MSQFFISYARKDLPIAEKIVDALAGDLLRPWIDWKSLPKGEILESELKHGIETSDTFLFLISPDSIRSDWCQMEIEHAVKNGKRIIPLLIRKTSLKELHPKIVERLFIEIGRGQSNFDIAIQETIKAIFLDNEWVGYHTKLQNRATEWKAKPETSKLLHGKELAAAIAELEKKRNSFGPRPTKAQKEYINASRRAAKRIQQRTAGFIIAAVFIITTIGLFAAKQANDRQAGELAAQAQDMPLDTADQSVESSLLALESFQLHPGGESTQAIQRIIETFGTKIRSLSGNLYLSKDASLMIMVDKNIATVSETLSQKNLREIVDETGIIDVYVSDDNNIIFTLDQQGQIIATHLDLEQSIKLSTKNATASNIVSSFDGSFVVAWNLSTDRLDVIDVRNNSLIPIPLSGGAKVDEVIFSPNGRLLATGSFNTGFVDVWEITTGEHLNSYQHEGNVIAIEFSPDSEYLASGGTVDGAYLIKADEAEVKCNFPVGTVFDIDFSPDGNTIVLAEGTVSDGAAWVWNANTCEQTTKLNHHGSVVNANFSPDGNMLVTGVSDGTARVWDLLSNKEISRVLHASEVELVNFIADTGFIASMSHEESQPSSVYIWWPKSQEAMAFSVPTQLNSMDFSEDGSRLVTTTSSGELGYWDANLGRMIDGHTYTVPIVRAEFLTPDKKMIATNIDGSLHLWNLDNWTEEAVFGKAAHINVSTTSLDGQHVITGSKNGEAVVWDLIAQEAISQSSYAGEVAAVALSPDGKLAAAGEGNKQDGSGFDVTIWNIYTQESLLSYHHDFWLNDIEFSPDGRMIVSSDNGGVALVWDVYANRLLTKVDLESPIAFGVFDPLANHVALGNADGIVSLIDINTADSVKRLQHQSSVGPMVFTKDGQQIFTGTANGTVYVWNTRTDQVSVAREFHQKISELYLIRDGKYVAAATYSGDIHIWAWQPEYLAERLCAMLPENLSLQEWSEYADSLEVLCPCYDSSRQKELNCPIPQETQH